MELPAMLDETIKKIETDPYQLNDNDKVQRSFYVPKWIWNAAEGLPGGRPNAIIQALLDKITAFSSEIPQLRYDVEQIDIQINALQAQKVAKLNRIKELEKADNENMLEVSRSEMAIQQAVVETISLVAMYRKDLGNIHYKRLEELSGTPASDIKQFIKEKKFMPTDDEIRMFYLR
jgi:hypothetical protein